MAVAICKNLLTGGASAQMYFIPVYVQLVLLTPLLGKLLGTRARPLLLVVSPLAVVAAVYVPLFGGFELPGLASAVWHECCLGWMGFYALGLALGNGLAHLRLGTSRLAALYCMALVLQVAEGVWFLSLGSQNCGTQLKLSSLLSSSLFCLIAWEYVARDAPLRDGPLTRGEVFLGDCSFGIYLCHIAVLRVVSRFIQLPDTGLLKAAILFLLTLTLSWGFVLLGGRLVGSRASKLLGLR